MAWSVVLGLGWGILCFWTTPAQAEDSVNAVDAILAEGWHMYSEELDFEAAAQAYQAAGTHPQATRAQKLEAFEYLAASFFALEEYSEARFALRELLSLNREQLFRDPSHPPEFMELLEATRGEIREPQPEPAAAVEEEPRVRTAPEAAMTLTTTETTEAAVDRKPWYKTWWFWTITGAVVAGAAAAGIAVGVSQRQKAPDAPAGNLPPGVVQLPLGGLSLE
jgi:tetratricopeptide (TPR) repeat protein